MRDGTPAPAPQALPPHVYRSTTVSDEPFYSHTITRNEAIARYLLALRASGLQPEMTPVAFAILVVLLTEIDGHQLPRLVASCSRGWLAQEIGRSVGHVQRAIDVLEYMGLAATIGKGGAGPLSINVYELLEPERAPALALSARRRAPLSRALARGYNPERAPARALEGSAGARTGGDTKDSILSAVTADRDASGRAPAAAAAPADLVKLLRDGGVDEAGIAALVVHPNFSREQVHVALAHLAATRAREPVRNPGGLLRKVIQEKWGPPATAEERRVARQPEHVQEDLARERQHRAAAAAKERSIDQALAALPEPELRRLVGRILQSHELPEFTLRRLEATQAEARSNVLWRGLLAAEISAANP